MADTTPSKDLEEDEDIVMNSPTKLFEEDEDIVMNTPTKVLEEDEDIVMNTPTKVLEEDEDIVMNTPSPTPLLSEATKINRTKQSDKVYDKSNIHTLIYYPVEKLSLPKHPSALIPLEYNSKQAEVHYLRMICEIVELKCKKFRFGNLRTVGSYIIFKNVTYLKDEETGHRIEVDFKNQLYDKIPELHSTIIIMGRIEHKSFVKNNKNIYVSYIVIKTWEEWSGEINFQEFYYHAKRFRNILLEETIPIEEAESDDSDYDDDDDDDCVDNMSDHEYFETAEFLDRLEQEELLVGNTEQLLNIDTNLFE